MQWIMLILAGVFEVEHIRLWAMRIWKQSG